MRVSQALSQVTCEGRAAGLALSGETT